MKIQFKQLFQNTSLISIFDMYSCINFESRVEKYSQFTKNDRQSLKSGLNWNKDSDWMVSVSWLELLEY